MLHYRAPLFFTKRPRIGTRSSSSNTIECAFRGGVFQAILIISLIIVSGCATGITTPSHRLYERQYYVTGKVSNQLGHPLPQCKVHLIKRDLLPFGNIKEQMDATTRQYIFPVDAAGQYLLTFEPDQANDIWLGFTDPSGHYEPRVVRLNEALGESLLEYPGNTSVIVNMVLQPIIKKEI